MKRIENFADWVIALDRSIANAPARHNKIVELVHMIPPVGLGDDGLPNKYFDLGDEELGRYSIELVCGRIVEWYKKYFYTSPNASQDLIARVTAVVTGSNFNSTKVSDYGKIEGLKGVVKEDQEFMEKMFNLHPPRDLTMGRYNPNAVKDLEERKKTKVSEYSVKYGKYGVKNDN